MAFLRIGVEVPEVERCSYAGSRLVFRGPARPLDGRFVAALGGSATFGKGVRRPWPQLLETATNADVVNFGAVGAGPDAFLGDAGVIAACARARTVILQLSGADALGNPYYQVHPRRNDRFLRATPALQALYPEVDFFEFSFVRHMLGVLQRRDRRRFACVARTLRSTWSGRMAALAGQLSAWVPVVLLWLGSGPPPEGDADPRGGSAPFLITRPMLEALRPRVAALVIPQLPTRDPVADAAASGAELPGCGLHAAAAMALAERLAHLPPPAARRDAG